MSWHVTNLDLKSKWSQDEHRNQKTGSTDEESLDVIKDYNTVDLIVRYVVRDDG